jgi:hypothetical protein
VITSRKAKSRVAVHVPAVDIRGNGEMFVALLREFACRTAQEHRENLQPAHSQLRVINSIARETLVATREFVGGSRMTVSTETFLCPTTQ